MSRLFADAAGDPIVDPRTGSFVWPDEAASDSDPGYPASEYEVRFVAGTDVAAGWRLARKEGR